MSNCIPSVLPFDATEGEKATLKELRKLNDNCYVYYEAIIRNKYPDFIVIHPHFGLIIIEVKDWKYKNIEKFENDDFYFFNSDYTTAQKPDLQIEDYEIRLIKTKNFKEKHKSRIYKIIIFSNMTKNEMKKFYDFELNSRINFIFEEDLSNFWKNIRKKTLPLPSFQVPACNGPVLTQNDVDDLRALIRPESKIEDDSLRLRLLDIEQEKSAYSAFGGHRLRYGPAGSGKTIILIARAKRAAEAGKKCLVLCYNKGLRAFLASKLKHKNITVRTFHKWAGDYQLSDNDHDKLGDKLRQKLQQGHAKTYDAVLIDEVQDFPKSWLQAALLALKDPEDGDLFMVGDGAQSPTDNFPFKHAGVKIQGGDRSRSLKKVYRNTRQIWDLSCALNSDDDGEPDSELGLGKGGTKNVILPDRDGPVPTVKRYDDNKTLVNYAVRNIEGMLEYGFEWEGRQENIEPCEIAIIVPRWNEGYNDFKGRLESLPKVEEVGVQSSNTTDRSLSLNQRALNIINVQSCKGLQFRHLFILYADGIRKCVPSGSEDEARMWLQIAIRRAEYSLTILHKGNCDFVNRLENHLRPAWYRPRTTAPRENNYRSTAPSLR